MQELLLKPNMTWVVETLLKLKLLGSPCTIFSVDFAAQDFLEERFPLFKKTDCLSLKEHVKITV